MEAVWKAFFFELEPPNHDMDEIDHDDVVWPQQGKLELEIDISFYSLSFARATEAGTPWPRRRSAANAHGVDHGGSTLSTTQQPKK